MDEKTLHDELEKNRIDKKKSEQELEEWKALTVQQITHELGVQNISGKVTPVKYKIPFKVMWKKRINNFLHKILNTVD